MDDQTANADQSLPRNKAELLRRIHAERAALEAVVNPLSDGQMTASGSEGWSVKDHLAHIVAWEQILVHAHLGARSFAEAARMDAATAQATATMTAETGINDWFYERDKDRLLANVLQNFHRSHREVLAALDKLEYADLIQLRDPSDPNTDPRLAYVVGDTYEHYKEHRQIIQAITQQPS